MAILKRHGYGALANGVRVEGCIAHSCKFEVLDMEFTLFRASIWNWFASACLCGVFKCSRQYDGMNSSVPLAGAKHPSLPNTAAKGRETRLGRWCMFGGKNMSNKEGKYVIHVTIRTDGTVQRKDVVGAIFGQTEGLLKRGCTTKSSPEER